MELIDLNDDGLIPTLKAVFWNDFHYFFPSRNPCDSQLLDDKLISELKWVLKFMYRKGQLSFLNYLQTIMYSMALSTNQSNELLIWSLSSQIL